MKRLREAIAQMLARISGAVLRFPLTVLCLFSATVLTCYIISLHETPGLFIEKLMFTFIVGAFLGVTAQFAWERFERLRAMRPAVYAVAALLTLGYYFIVAPAPAIDFGVGGRTGVAVFSLFCAFIWLPSYQDKADFNCVALVHFKSAAISALYAGVLAVGLAAIIGTVDILLFDVDGDVFGYMMAIVWIFFAPIYYLSLLPRFNSEEKPDRLYVKDFSHIPRFLEILVSYIAVPLVAVYTLVLLAYFVKIGITRVWPSGQLGPMVLGYSSAGLIIYVLASRMENRFAVLYQRVFPKVLIPVVVMQLVSVYIRLQAYGFTESRYYVALFGIFSIAAGLFLSFRPVKKNGVIALLAAAFAVFSIIPPVDAFTVSRNSQVARLETMLQRGGILEEGKIKAKPNADETLRIETTSILNYLERRRYLDAVSWLPENYQDSSDMKKVFGFDPVYPQVGKDDYFYAGLDMQKPINIEGYDVLLRADSYWHMDEKQEPSTYDFKVQGIQYKLVVERVSPLDARVSVKDAAGKELVSTGLYEFAASIKGLTNQPKESLDAETLTLDAAGSGSRLRIIFQNINISSSKEPGAGAAYDMFVLFDAPPQE